MKRWRLEEIENISLLLESGNSLKDSLLLVNEMKANMAFPYFKEDLLLLYVKQFFPRSILPFILPLLAFNSLQEALPLALSFFHEQHKRYLALRKKLQYPFLLFCLSLVGVFVFKAFVLPSLYLLVTNFKGDTSLFTIFNFLFDLFYLFLFVSIILFLLSILLLQKKSRKVFIYSFLAKYWPSNPWVLLVSYEFVYLWQKCRQLGLGSKDSLFLIRKLKEKTPTSFLAYHFMSLLEEGEEVIAVSNLCYIDQSFKRFINLALYSQKGDYLFERYLFYNQLRLAKMLKQFITCQQIFIYLFIGGAIIMIYQILFIPLKAMSAF